MDKEEKLKQLMEESRLLFLKEEQEKLNQVMKTLLKYRLHRRREEACELERFFHSLKGTSSTLEFENLSSIGKEYEDYINTFNGGKDVSERFFLKLLDGLARVQECLEEISIQFKREKGDEGEVPNSNSDDSGVVGDSVSNSCEDIDNSNEKKSEAGSEDKKTILLIDDVGVILHLMEDHLSSLNYHVIIAKDGQEGIRKCKTLKPHLMLVDLMLPKVDGFEVCREIKNDPNTKNTRIIVVSSKNKKDDIIKCFEAGVDDYMVKPFKMYELEQRVRKLLGD